MSDQLNFYDNLPAFSQFEDLCADRPFTSAPSDWWIIISTVTQADQAISEGRYKDVNTVGVATIAAIKNGFDGRDFPYTFKGDGSSSVVPPDYVDRIKDELYALQNIVKSEFQFDLKIAVLPIKEVLSPYCKVQVGKFELTDGNYMTMFKGGGMAQAQKLVREQSHHDLQTRKSSHTDLHKLSCRWEPIRSRNGQMLCLLVKAKDENESKVYKEFLDEFNQILPEQKTSRPVNHLTMSYKGPSKNVADETRYGQSRWFKIIRGFTVAWQTILFLFPWFRNFVFRKYLSDMDVNTDYRKFDDMLKMLVDCTSEQAKDIEELCQRFYKENKVFFGLHSSKNALMTCFVEDLFKGKHMHFLDGDNGGYAMAAIPMKAQMSMAV